MEKVDIAIAAIGVVALVATTLGVVFYEELAGEVDVHFDHQMMAVEQQSGTPRAYTFAVPMNATGGDFDVNVAFSGQSGTGGNAGVSIVLNGPNGETQTTTGTVAVPQNSASASGDFAIAGMWDTMPEDTTTDDPENFDASRSYAEPVTITVSVTNPTGELALPVVNYTWTITINGEWHTFEHSFDTGNVESV